MIDAAPDTSIRPTATDIARVAGVSLATVDRVLNARPGVRTKTIKRVQDAISQLGYVRDPMAANLARRRHYRLLFVLPDGRNKFVDALKAQIDQQAAHAIIDRTMLTTVQVTAFDPQAMARVIRDVDTDAVDGIAVMGPETPSIRDAVDQVRAKGVPVVSLVSDLPSSARDHFVGIDNIAAGRTAGLLMTRFLRQTTPEILVVAGSMLARDHLERRLGFDAVIAETSVNVNVLASLEGHDDPDQIERLLPLAFKAHPDIAGIYALGGGVPGLTAFLHQHGLEDRITVIAHELTADNRVALMDGTIDAIISQDTGHLIRSAIRVLRAKADNADINMSQETIRIDVFLRENVPPIVTSDDT